MAYIGNSPTVGAFKKLDNLTFDGVTTTFTCAVGGVATQPGTPTNLIISISGVLQEPGNSYTVSGSSIIFSEAPLAADTFFGVLLGNVGEVNSVTDGAITSAKLAPDSVTTSNILGGNVTAAKLAAGSAVSNIGFTPYNAANPSGFSGNGANTYSGTQTGSDNVLSGWLAKDIGSVFVDKGTVGTGTVTFDYTGGSCQRLQVSGAITLATSNFPPNGNLGVMQLEIVNGGSAAVTFPIINWVKLDGTFTTSVSTYLTNVSRNALQTTGIDFIMIWSRDGGTNIYGKIL